MIPSDLQSRLQLLLKTAAPALIEVVQPTPAVEIPHWTPGQRLPAEVMATLPNGRFQVKVDDTLLDMNLPQGARVGDKLGLTLVATQPRLTFIPTQPQGATQHPGQSQVALSPEARLIGTLLEKAVTNQAAPLTQSAALLSAAPADGAKLAQALQQALTQSGLFYESHQAQWVNGQKPLAELRQEPQAQLPPLPARTHEARAAAAPLPALSSGGDEAVAAGLAGSPFSVNAENVTQSSLQAGVHPQTLPLMEQQLQAYDSRQIVWQGQAWPGQELQWRVEEEVAQGGAEATASVWHSRLDLELPQLGKVTALLSLHGGALQIRLSADDVRVASRLDAGRVGLHAALDTAGIALTAMTVESHDA